MTTGIHRVEAVGDLQLREHMGNRYMPWQERFWSRVEKTETCWLWHGPNVRGYGHMQIDNKTKSCHRISWEMHNGAIPHGMMVLHKCDRPACVRPGHLFLGTNQDNQQDASRKGRLVARTAGEVNGQAILTEEQVDAIRARYDRERVTMAELAAAFGVTHTAVQAILERKTWRHIPSGKTERVRRPAAPRPGHKSALRRVSEDDVRLIRDAHALGFQQRSVAKWLGIDFRKVNMIVKRRIYANVA